MVDVMRKWWTAQTEWLNSERDGRPLGLFRVVFFSIMFLEVLDFEQMMPLLVDEIPGTAPSDWKYSYLFLAWKIALVGVVIGMPSRSWRIVNWIFCVGFFGSVSLYEYHMFYAWTGISFLSIFVGLNSAWSVNGIWRGVLEARSGQKSIPMMASNWDSYIILIVGVAFVYADSVLWKLTDPAWVGGLGMYRPASLPYISYDSWLTDGRDAEWVFRFLGALTLLFEASFIFIIKRALSNKWWALIVMAIGVGLHGGIALMFPLPFFGWGYAAFFLLLIPVDMFRFRLPWGPVFVFYYDIECPLCCQTHALLGSLNWLRLLSFVPVQSLSPSDFKSMGTTESEMLLDIGGKWTGGGSLNFGVSTYQRALLLIPLLAPLGCVMWVPGLSHLARRVYGGIAQNRLVNRCTFDSCGISSKPVAELELISGFTWTYVRRLSRLGLLLFLILTQSAISHQNGILRDWSRPIDEFFGGYPHRVIDRLEPSIRPYTGLTSHALFMRHHFDDYLKHGCFFGDGFSWPLDSTGAVNIDDGPLWAVWTWRVHGPRRRGNHVELRNRIRVFLEREHNVELTYAAIDCLEFPNGYDADFRVKAYQDFDEILEKFSEDK